MQRRQYGKKPKAPRALYKLSLSYQKNKKNHLDASALVSYTYARCINVGTVVSIPFIWISGVMSRFQRLGLHSTPKHHARLIRLDSRFLTNPPPQTFNFVLLWRSRRAAL
jgi:hypothetical protein